MSWSSPPAALLLVGSVLGVGAYAVAVLDGLVDRRVAGARRVWAAPVTEPVQRVATLLVTRRSTTERPDGGAWALGPALVTAMAAAAIAAVPWAPEVAVADVDDGIVLFGAAMAVVMVAVLLHGWSANSLFPMVGGYRFVALALSYEMPLALVLIAAALPAESLSVGEIVEAQAGVWNVVRQPLGLPLFLVAGLGLATWGPVQFAAGSDLADGTAAEDSGPARLAWELARRCVLVTVAAMAAATFLGGWHGPLLPDPVWMIVKTLAVLGLLAWIGHRVARLRLERFVVIAWAVLIPLALVNVFWSGLLAL